MDGFVNDQDTAHRRGLHARDPENMVAWDSVVGHHLGLSHAHKAFVESFKKTDPSKITELYRNGIIHGNLPNFDNVVVATKAWNRLSAITDWAEAEHNRNKSRAPSPSWSQLIRESATTNHQLRAVEDWEPYEYDITSEADCETVPSEIVVLTERLFDAWTKQQWGHVSALCARNGHEDFSDGKFTALVKDLYKDFSLSASKVIKVRHERPSIAFVDVDLIVNNLRYGTALRWVRFSHDGDFAYDFEPGEWKLGPFGPEFYLKEKCKVTE